MVHITSSFEVDVGKLEEVSKIFTYSTGINSKVFNYKGEVLAATTYRDQINFCDLVWNQGKDKEVCKHAYIHGGFQSAKKGDVYVYFCPYGMVKLSVAVLKGENMSYFLCAGPLLVHPVDDLMVERVINRNNKLKNYSTYVRNYLQEIDYVDSDRIYWLAKLLYNLVQGSCFEESQRLESSEKPKAWVNSRLYQHEEENIKKEGFDDNFLKSLLYREKKLLEKIELGDKKGGEKLADWLVNNFASSDGDIELLKLKAVELVVILSRKAIELGCDIELIFEKEYVYFQKIQKCEDKNELCGCLNEIIMFFVKESNLDSGKRKSKVMITKAIDYIEKNYKKELKLEDVAKEVGLSSAYFSRIFKQETGLSFTEYVNRVRVKLSKEMLKDYSSLADVALNVGFSDQSYFCKTFKRITGLSPGKYKNAIYSNLPDEISRESK
ncbi:HTH-type transcriptional regulator YesS [Natranaerofaba carboxydovora]|nr:HTH-type transcriptional regulator YesS [Natranaerofaba carboxydovora]